MIILVDRLRYAETIESSITVETVNDSLIIEENLEYLPLYFPISDDREFIGEFVEYSFSLKHLGLADILESTDKIHRIKGTITMTDSLIITDQVEEFFIYGEADDELIITDNWLFIWGLRNFTVSDILSPRETHTVQ